MITIIDPEVEALMALRQVLAVRVLTGALTPLEALARLHATVDFYCGRWRYVRQWGRR